MSPARPQSDPLPAIALIIIHLPLNALIALAMFATQPFLPIPLIRLIKIPRLFLLKALIRRLVLNVVWIQVHGAVVLRQKVILVYHNPTILLMFIALMLMALILARLPILGRLI